MKIVYNTLHNTVPFEEMTTTATVITTSFSFGEKSLTQTQGSDTAKNLTLVPATPTLQTDTDRTYLAVVNVHSANVRSIAQQLTLQQRLVQLSLTAIITTAAANTNHLSFHDSQDGTVPS